MTSAVTTTPADILRLAAGVQVIGEMAGSGYRIPPSLVRRGDGQTIQLTPLLLAILREIDGRRTSAEIADAVSAATGRGVSAANVDHLVEHQLRPLGLLVCIDGSEPSVRKRNPLLGLRFRYAISDPDRTRRITRPFQFLFRSWAVIPLLIAFGVVCWWVFIRKGLAAATWDAFERPGLLILVFVVTILSAGFHEFGHAAAARYGGATPGVMGFGVYLVWPAFYTDVTDSYRLGRWGRLRTDLGGLYFNAIVAVVITGLWSVLRYDALLLIVATQILQMLRQLAPMVRFDGYHVVADITGVPDLYSRIKPTLLGALPWRWGDPEAGLLKRWARVVVTAWVLIVVPLLLSVMVGAILALPRLLGTAWLSLTRQWHVLSGALAGGDMVQAVARVLAMVAIVIPVAGTIYMLTRVMRQSAAGAWRGTTGKPMMRTVAVLCGSLVLSGMAWAWWPREGNYLPIKPTEHGAFFNIELMPAVHRMDPPGGESRRIGLAAAPAASSPGLAAGKTGVMRAMWDNKSARPSRTAPRLAVILVPRTRNILIGNNGGSNPAPSAAAPSTKQGWVFPFDKPMAPGPGDNQALAVNTTDGTIVYDTAFALVWVTDNSYAMNINDGEAYASCRNCAAVAVAYQVVFVIDSNPNDNNVVAPQNLAGALNYNCVNCMTYGLARQLFLRLEQPLSPTAMVKLTVLWAEITAYGYAIKAGVVPINEINGQLASYTEQILAIVQEDQPGVLTPIEPPTASATSEPAASSTAVAVATNSPTQSAPSPLPSSSATATPSAVPQTEIVGATSTSSTTSSSTPASTPTSGSIPVPSPTVTATTSAAPSSEPSTTLGGGATTQNSSGTTGTATAGTQSSSTGTAETGSSSGTSAATP